MSQTILTVVSDVEPASAPVLLGLINRFRNAEETESRRFPIMYDRLRAAVPTLHFMSMTVFNDPQYDPILVIECNFDGAAGPFFALLEEGYGPLLRDMLRCCKTPPGRAFDMFANVVAPGSRAPIAPMLEALTVWPAVSHQGNRDMTRDRVERERQLFVEIRCDLDAGRPGANINAVTIHRTLRDRLLPRFPWLDTPEAPIIPRKQNWADWRRITVFGLAAALVLMVPGVVLSLALPVWVTGLLLTLAMAWAADKLDWLREMDREYDVPVSQWVVRAVLVLPVAGILASTLPAHGAWRLLPLALSGIIAVIPSAMLVLLWLRRLEQRDSSLDAPVPDEQVVQALASTEDQVHQNHMISIVHLKPGVLRAPLIRAGLHGLHAALRVLRASREGYLASMRTIHFAHWALLNNGGRLMFQSNFDGTWESYLDDFIEKAHVGLTLAWSSSVGFPPTRFLFLDGATQGRRFKNWARHSMAPSQFWFSAYHDLTVNQIDRQRRIADGLRKRNLSQQEAEKWALDL